MKITDVKVVKANRCVFAKILTDEGIYGIGEAGAWGLLEASASAIHMFKDYLVGKDPLDIEHHWQYMQRFGPVSYTHLDVYKRQMHPLTMS